jgi:hypothetical protein
LGDAGDDDPVVSCCTRNRNALERARFSFPERYASGGFNVWHLQEIIMFRTALVPLAFASLAIHAASSVTGSGTVTFGSSVEHITVNATGGATATAGSGRATFQDKAAGGNVNGQIDVNCVQVVGTTATVSGTVTHSNNKSLIGQEAVFQIVDNGNTDLASIINFHPVGTSTNCTAGEFDVAPVKGNFTVQQ